MIKAERRRTMLSMSRRRCRVGEVDVEMKEFVSRRKQIGGRVNLEITASDG